jgi:hypothetical protein
MSTELQQTDVRDAILMLGYSFDGKHSPIPGSLVP